MGPGCCSISSQSGKVNWTPLSLDEPLRIVQGYVEYYKNTRLNSAIGQITPKDMLAGRQRRFTAKATGDWTMRASSANCDTAQGTEETQLLLPQSALRIRRI